MTGLFGANAVRSPLSDVPSMKARNSQELNAMIETALLPDTFRKARLVCQAMHPIENTEGYSNEVRLDELDPETAVQVRDVLNAGAIIGAVRRGERPGHYLVRSELLEFLNTVIKRELETNKDQAEAGMLMDQMEDQLVVALLPEVGQNAEAVLSELVPMDDDRGFTSQVSLDEVDEEVRPVMLNVLNTGATFARVQRIRNSESYYVHKDLYKTLARIRAREVGRGSRLPQIAGRQDARQGGSITPKQQPQRAIADHTRHQNADDDGEQEPPSYLDALIESLGVAPEAFTSLSGSAYDAARLAADAMTALRQSNRALDQELTGRDQQEHARLERVLAHLDGGLAPEDGLSRQRLNSAWEEVEQNWNVLMLLPNGPYESALADVIEQLEPDSGAGMLKGDDQVLLAIARRAHQSLASNARRTDRDWITLEKQFQLVLRTPTQQVAEDNANRRLN
jgi:hypothetical protein